MTFKRRTQPSSATWDLKTPRDLFEKARRELRRFRDSFAAQDGEQADHAMNFAITAWHLCDWVYYAKPHRWEAELQPPQGKEVEWVQKHLCAQCDPELPYCGEIANGSKHFELSTDLKIETVTSSRFVYQAGLDAVLTRADNPAPAHGVRLSGGSSPLYVSTPQNPIRVPKIVFREDSTKLAIEIERIFWRVLAFWKRTLKKEGLW